MTNIYIDKDTQTHAYYFYKNVFKSKSKIIKMPDIVNNVLGQEKAMKAR